MFFTGQTNTPVLESHKGVFAECLNKADILLAREKYTYSFYKQNTTTESYLTCDDVFLINNKVKINNTGEYIIINIKDFANNFSKYEIFLQKLRTTFFGEKIIIVPFRPDKRWHEYIMNEQLAKQLNAEIIVPKNVEELCDIFNNSKMVISSAYHAIVLAILFKKNVIGIYDNEYYKIKILGILDLFGIGNATMTFEEFYVLDIDKYHVQYDDDVYDRNVKNLEDGWEKILNIISHTVDEHKS